LRDQPEAAKQSGVGRPPGLLRKQGKGLANTETVGSPLALPARARMSYNPHSALPRSEQSPSFSPASGDGFQQHSVWTRPDYARERERKLNYQQVADKIYRIDDLLYGVPDLGSVYLLVEDKVALIDSGPASSAPVVLDAIRQIGVSPEQVDYLILTHIHLDHSGGAGLLARDFPRAQVLAHHRAVKHLIDPTRLVNSAIAAQGKDVMARNGDMLPVEGRRIVPVHDGDKLELGAGQVLTLLETPGHAPHSVCIRESRNRGLFVGDSVGHIVEGTDVMVPITPPPGFDQQLYIATLERVRQLDASMIYFPHSGVSTRVPEKLDTAMRKLRERQAVIEKAFASGQGEGAAAGLADHICAELGYVKDHLPAVYGYWQQVDIPMSAGEHVRYYRNTHALA
jgi:glyoxylase-like metal-dependent hydrolase (beta-lactamase superfamily II)